MEIDRLPATVSTLYSETLEQALVLERTAGSEGLFPGGIVSKEVRGRRYLYWQVRKGEEAIQRYLGPDSQELRDALARMEAKRLGAAEQRATLDRLAAMLVQGGASREESRVVEVVRLLADLGLFRRGGVLLGTQAYRLFGNFLAVRLPAASLRTQDIDVAHSIDIAIAAAAEPAISAEAALATLGMLPIPGLDSRQPSTSFHMRGRELRVDFLTPVRRGGHAVPIAIPGLGLSAWPLSGLDYLIESPIPAVMLGNAAVLVKVPSPGRFALHKLWTARSRPVSEHGKAAKDRAQAASVIRVLAADRPDELRQALQALAKRPSIRRRVLVEIDSLPPELRAWQT